MSTVGASDLLNHFGSELAVAEALLLGRIEGRNLKCVDELVTPIILEAARIRLEAKGMLTKAHIKGGLRK